MADTTDIVLGGGTFQPNIRNPVEVVVSGSSFSMCRASLSNGSGFFFTLFSGSWKDSHCEGSIRLDELEGDVFAAFADYITKGKCTLADDSLLLPLLSAAHMLQVPLLLAAAGSEISARLCPENVIAAWQTADALCLDALRATTEAIMLRRLPEVIDLMLCLEADYADEGILLKASCSALRSLCSSGRPHGARCREFAAASGAIEAIVALMHREEAHKSRTTLPQGSEYEVLHEGCLALANICEGSKQRWLRAAHSGALQMALALKRREPADPKAERIASCLIQAAQAQRQTSDLALIGIV